ncbi:MAG: AI-2E family transporter [Antarcticimicrobium sp.]|uniref:AI-2E family transporter n=1 Tax=Antarcticimicrobium sp. TaxID=2824147 RepID=UPI00263756F7|nr:AI-2E family transporter [Antarcticimicrobium sp.]MDF1718260.1 AI-2E family transporter [Antarcticimicrobium sp.]
MALPVRDQLRYWGIALVATALVLWFLGDVLLPFVLGGAIAYFLDPAADRLERAGCSRPLATAIISVLGVLIFVVLALLVIPTLISQAVELINIAPKLFHDLQTFLTERFPSLVEPDSTLRQSLDSLGETIRSKGGELLNTMLSSAVSIVNLVLVFVIAPVVAVYLLLDWDNMIAGLDELLPRDHAPVIRQLAKEIDKTLSSFVRGMGTVCLILGTYYAVALMLIGLQFGLVVGFVAGVLTFIPYVGALVGGALAIGLALFQFWGEWWWIVIVAVIFQVGQLAEGNYLTPKLVGKSVGLHPVWLILALSVFGSVFGFVGMLVAVPVAAALGVLARFGMAQYRESRLYMGITDQDDD